MLLFLVFVLQITLSAWFEDFTALVAFVPTATAFIFTQLLKVNVVLNDTWKKIVTLLFSIIVTFVAHWLGWGIFALALWWHLLLYGVLGGLVAMGIFQFGWAQFILSILQIPQSKDKYNKLNKIKDLEKQIEKLKE